jgi:hypothetical protein
MARKKDEATHVAVHSVQYRNADGALVEAKAGTHFTPNDADVEALTKARAIREITDADRKSVEGQKALQIERTEAPAGYADNTSAEQPVYSGGVSNPNDIPAGVEANTSANPDGVEASVASSDLDGKLPSSRTTKR